MNHAPLRSPIAKVCCVAASAALVGLASPGCGTKDVHSVDISASKKVAAEKGIAGPGPAPPAQGRSAAQ